MLKRAYFQEPRELISKNLEKLTSTAEDLLCGANLQIAGICLEPRTASRQFVATQCKSCTTKSSKDDAFLSYAKKPNKRVLVI